MIIHDLTHAIFVAIFSAIALGYPVGRCIDRFLIDRRNWKLIQRQRARDAEANKNIKHPGAAP